MSFFIEVEKNDPKIHMEAQKPQTTKAILSTKNNTRVLQNFTVKYITVEFIPILLLLLLLKLKHPSQN